MSQLIARALFGFITLTVSSSFMILNAQQMEHCDPNGFCKPAPLDQTTESQPTKEKNMKIYYVGDPMCSWCWGIANHLTQFQDYLAKENIEYDIIVGGLRPGGGDPWNEQLKGYLKKAWKTIHERTGQPFKFDLLEAEQFHYDTEPSCRAVVTAKHFLDSSAQVSEFFKAIQYKFYAQNEDPKTDEFYRSITADFNIDYEAFLSKFHSEELKEQTKGEFVLNREWGVGGYPSLVIEYEDKLYSLANGYASYEDLVKRMGTFSKKIVEQN